MSQELGFTLGLASGNFLATAAKAEGAVGSLISKAMALPGLGVVIGGLVGSVSSLNSVVENTFAQFEKGAGLAALSKQTGESVANLFSLEKGFKAVHLSADMVGPALFQMQKALGGFSEFGEPTKDLFASMGLSVEALKTVGATDQIQQITRALAGLSQEEAAMASSKIFGRSAGREMLQLGRGGAEFANAVKAAAPQAEIMAKNALAFERIEASLARAKSRTQGLFLGLAEGAAPGIQAALDAINKIDLTGLGQKLGHVFAGLGEAFAQNQFGEIFELSMKAGIVGSANFLAGSVHDAMVRGISGFDFRSLAGVGKAILATSPGGLLGLGAARLASTKFEAGGPDAFLNPYKDKLAKKMAALTAAALARTQGGDPDAEWPRFGLGGAVNTKHRTQNDVNALERIGLVRLGGGGRDDDHAQQTAKNTGTLIEVLRTIRTDLINGLKPLADNLFGNQ